MIRRHPRAALVAFTAGSALLVLACTPDPGVDPGTTTTLAPATTTTSSSAPTTSTTTSTTTTTSTSTTTTTTTVPVEWPVEMLQNLNAKRAAAGAPAVTICARLQQAAQAHSADQAAMQQMTHTGSNGSTVGQRVDATGYAWTTVAENVAFNQSTVAAVMTAWFNSPGHQANMLNPTFTHVGFGRATSNGPYWTQVFARGGTCDVPM